MRTVGPLHPQPGLLPLSQEIILEEMAQTKMSSSRAHVSKILNQGHFFIVSRMMALARMLAFV